MQKFSLYLRYRQHTSVFIAFTSLGVLIGVALSLLPLSHIFTGLGWLVFAILLIIICFWKRSTWLLSFVILAGMLFGVARANPVQQDNLIYSTLTGKTVNIQGKISDDVSTGKHDEKQIKLVNIKINGKELSGFVWLSTNTHIDLKRSFEVNATGKLSKGFGNFSASIFRAEIVKATDSHEDKAREIRDWFASNIRSVLNEPQASLGIGYLVGQRSSLPESLEQSLRIVGLTHIVVASGYNLTILVRFARRIFAPISKYLATLAGSSMIAGFILVTGFSPSMTRAGLVAGISLATWYYGRHVHPLILLPFVAAITVLINPSYMWGDLGWYLSFSAFAGVMILAPLLQNYFFGQKKLGTIRQILGETISAQIVTIPIIAYSFGTIAIFALPANLLVLPFVPIAMILVFVTGLAEIIMPSVSHIFAIPTQTLLQYMTSVVEWFVKIPNASVEVSFGTFALAISYLVLIIIAIYLQKATKHNFDQDNIVE